MSDKCKQSVYSANIWTKPHQCRNKAKKDGYCGIHHPEAVKAREEKSRKRWDDKYNNSPSARLEKALSTISTQSQRIKELESAMCIFAREELGNMCFESDREAIDYFLSLEDIS